METEIIAQIEGKIVFINKNSHIHGDIKNLLREAIPFVNFSSSFIKSTVVFDRIIGYTHCVKTTESDTIYHEKRNERPGKSRMVLNRKPEICDKLTVILKEQIRNHYQVITSYIGDTAEPEPWDRCLKDSESRKKSAQFWNNHALIKE
jgi:hypothetical protein